MTEPATGKWRFDMQTLILLGGVAGTLIAWGYTLSEIQSDVERNSLAVFELGKKMERNDSKTDMNEARIAALEKVADDAIMLRRELEGTISLFRSDIAVIKEILIRIDKDNRNQGKRQP